MQSAPPPRPWLILLALWALNFAVSAQFLVVTPILPVIRDQLNVAEDWLGLLITTYAVGVGVFSLIAGPISDRFGRRVIIVTGAVGMTIALLLHGLAFNFPLLLGMRLLAGSCSGLLSGATIAYVGDAFPFHQRGRANGILASGFAAGQIFGIPLGAILGEMGYRLPFVVFGIFGGVAALLIVLFLVQPPVKLMDRLTLGSALKGYGALLVRRDTAVSAAAYAVMFLAVSLFITYLPTYLNARFDASPTEVSTLFMVGGVANLIVAPFAGALSDRVGRKVLVVGGSAVMGVLIFATPWILPQFWVAYPLFFIVMVFVALRISPMQALVTSLVPARQRGSLLSLDFAVGQVGFGLGSLVAGPIYTRMGFVATATAAGVFALGMAVLVLVGLPEPESDAEDDPADAPEPATAGRS